VYTPRLDKNIALAIMDIEFSALDTTGTVITPEGNYPVMVVQKPFYDPKKKIASKS
jgi:glycine cleavage system aminomethyltransferase T